MTLVQARFFNSSVTSFNTNIGWGNQTSQLTVNLVDDVSAGDAFSPPGIGTPCYFSYQGFNFGGILQSYKTLNSFSGKPTYEIILIDPRELLDGVQLIIDSFNGDVSAIPNLYNCYSYWENNTFGSALVNDGGMPYEKIRDAFLTLHSLTPLQFKSYIFYVDLTELPSLPSYYRIGGGVHISLMEFISRICEDGGSDFFFTMINVNGLNTIKLRVVSRYLEPILGTIPTFISQNTNGQATSSDYGAELRNETTSRFLVGGNIESIYLQTQQNIEGDDPNENLSDDTIIQFWGTDEFGNIIIPEIDENDEDNFTFTLPSRLVNVVGVGETYPTDVKEMRAALGGQASWETYLWSQNGINTSAHYKKASKVGLLSNLRQNITDFLTKNITTEAAFRAMDLRTLAPLTGYLLNKSGDVKDPTESNIVRLYNFVKAYADEFYGKKFLVRIPTIQAALESDTGIIRTNVEPSDGGYLDETAWPAAINNNYLPTEIDKLTLEDTRIVPYVRYDNIIVNNTQLIDISEVSEDNVVWETKYVRSSLRDINTFITDLGGTPLDEAGNPVGGPGSRAQNTFAILYAFIKCELEPKIYYLNAATATSPRVVIKLPGRVMPLTDSDDFHGTLRAIFTTHIRNIGITTKATIDDMIKNVFNRFGSEQLLYGFAGLSLTPDLVGAPIKSNVDTYGPWHALGAIGKSDFQQETSLVPWNYGGFTQMNLVAEAMVNQGLTFQQQAETGSIEIPGAPAANLGDVLISNGPYVTNIGVSVGANGVTTSYRMETWTARFGKLARSNIDRVTRLSKVAQTNRKMIRAISRVPTIGSTFFAKRENILLNAVERKGHHTSHTYLCGDSFSDPSGNTKANVTTSPPYNLPWTINSGNYPNKAFVSLDGLFRPFSTYPTATGISHYETPISSGTGNRSVTELDPYKRGHDINTVAAGSTLPSDDQSLFDLISSGVEQRPLALRGPLVLSGWGYDTSDKPVPNANPSIPTDNFADNYLQRSDLWKTGPVDLKWNNDRKIWITGGGAFRVAILKENLVGGSSASGLFLTPNFNSGTGNLTSWTEISGLIRFYDGFEFSYPTTPSGARIYVQKEETSSQWFVFAAGIY
jgi:hypothetical protein